MSGGQRGKTQNAIKVWWSGESVPPSPGPVGIDGIRKGGGVAEGVVGLPPQKRRAEAEEAPR